MPKPEIKTPEADIEIEDAEGYIGGSPEGLSQKQIVLEQYRRCCLEGSKEMVRGGTATKIIRGMPVKVEQQNQIEVFMNAIEILYSILVPELKTYPELQKQIEEVNKQLARLAEEYKKAGESNLEEAKKRQGSVRWDDLNIQFERRAIPIYRSKLVVLSELLKELNYFGEGGATNY